VATITIHSFDMAACHDVPNVFLLGVDRVLGLAICVCGHRDYSFHAESPPKLTCVNLPNAFVVVCKLLPTINFMLNDTSSDMCQFATRACGVPVRGISYDPHAERHLI
jgi:hypothetical protein